MTFKEKYNQGTKELHELTIAIEYAINEGGLRGNVAKDNLSSQFNDKLKQFITDLRKHDEEELIKIIGTFTPTCGYESEEEKGYQKGIQAEQSLIKKNIKDYYAK